MTAETIIAALIPLVFLVMLIIERRAPGRALPRVRLWLLKGVVAFVLVGVANVVVSAVASYMLGSRSPLRLAVIGTVPSAVVGILVVDFFNYWIHRTEHRFHRLWRWTHQWHHSAERMDLAGLSYQHPFDAISNLAMTALIVFTLGVDPVAGALIGFLQFATAVLGHTNVATPTAIGYFVARPEQHALHHARGVHAFNYAQLPMWDLLFGTFRNPPRGHFPPEYGFWDGASERMGAMLIGKDVGRP